MIKITKWRMQNLYFNYTIRLSSRKTNEKQSERKKFWISFVKSFFINQTSNLITILVIEFNIQFYYYIAYLHTQCYHLFSRDIIFFYTKIWKIFTDKYHSFESSNFSNWRFFFKCFFSLSIFSKINKISSLFSDLLNFIY